MKAIAYHRHGPPEVLQYEDVEKPAPGDGEVSIRIRAASLNPYDWHFIFGSPRIGRPFSRRFPTIAGHAVAGAGDARGAEARKGPLRAGGDARDRRHDGTAGTPRLRAIAGGAARADQRRGG